MIRGVEKLRAGWAEDKNLLVFLLLTSFIVLLRTVSSFIIKVIPVGLSWLPYFQLGVVASVLADTILDIQNEVFGIRKAAISYGIVFLMKLALPLILLCALSLPVAGKYADIGGAVNVALDLGFRHSLSTILSFTLGQGINVMVYHLIRRVWSRSMEAANLLSTVVASVGASVILTFFTFGLLGKPWVALAFAGFLSKTVMAFLNIPIHSFVCRSLRRAGIGGAV